MPPSRIPPAKAVKTERTHEENQERAYIAASRRSDRSLEARVESARRASEIHKRRTGRSLRVTEQDVQNEEMYEEEDDDLPLQYRRLTAHLQTGSADFNRRLSAYLTNHVAMRSALEQSIHNSYAQQFPNAPQYATPSMFPSPMLAHQGQQQQMMQPPQSPSLYRQSPYTTQSPRMQQGFSLSHQRSNSVSQPSTASPTEISQQRSMSTATPSGTGTYSPSTSTVSTTTTTNKPSFPVGSFNNAQMQPQNQNQDQFSLPTYDMGAFASSQFPSFTTQLPGEAQGFLGGTLDPNDPLTSMMMSGSTLPGTTYNFTNGTQQENGQQSTYTKRDQHYPSLEGLNATLAPGPMDKGKEKIDLKDEVIEGTSFFDSAMVGERGSALNTPGLDGESWDSWINDSQWDIPTASQ